MAILEIKNLNFSYNGKNKKALTNINFSIEKGEFILICGESGCGKSTLLKMIKAHLTPKGNLSGDILYNNQNFNSLDEKTLTKDFGFVMQNPNNQIVTDKVWHELSFGLESLGTEQSLIRKKVAEISSYFGINNLYHSKTDKLSGGQKQLINLASIMVMEPNILLLDEPTSQLDPITAAEFLNTIKKINKDLGITIILVEHRLEEVFNIADKILLMNKSEIINFDTPKNTVKYLHKNKLNMSLGLPAYVNIYSKLENKNN